MKTCPACGLHVEDDYLYCWEDGTRLNGGETVILSRRPTAPMDPAEHRTSLMQTAEAVDDLRVLSCPACGGEFPLTFAACPVHDLPLTQKRISRSPAMAQASAAVIEEPIAQAIVSNEQTLSSGPVEYNDPDIACEAEAREGCLNATAPLEDVLAPTVSRWAELRDSGNRLWQRITGGSIFASDSPGSRQAGGPPGMRIAARATAIALGLFAVAALYAFYRQVTRTPARSGHTVAVQSTPSMESPLIATPPEARDYKDEAPATAQPSAPEELTGPEPQKPTKPYAISNDAAVPRINTPSPSGSTPAAQPSIKPAETSELPPLPSGGRFNAELVRVRTYKASSGYSYALTFTLFEHTGRPMKWERLSIVTHSASGATRSEMVPFQHWLAGSGALTFTLNVDMVGTSEADWRGRISCMSVGADETGRPMRATFGTNVSP